MVKIKTITSAALAIVMSTSPGLAIGPVDGAYKQIQLTAEQEMLTQRIAAAACYYNLAVERDRHREILREGLSTFRTNLKSLRAERPRAAEGPSMAVDVSESLVQLDETWRDFERTVVAYDATPVPEMRQTTAVAAFGMTLAETAAAVHDAYLERFLNDGRDHTLDNALAAATRLGMLTLRASKSHCLVALGVEPDRYRRELKATITQFETSLGQLMKGDDRAGVAGPVSLQHQREFERLQRIWALVRPRFASALQADEVHHFDFEAVANLTDVMLRRVQNTLSYYSEA